MTTTDTLPDFEATKHKIAEEEKVCDDVCEKKVKLGEEKSIVLHLRGLPNDIREAEITGLAIPFGRVSNLVLSKNSGQALMEMEDYETASAMVAFYEQCNPMFGNRACQIQFSKYTRLSKDKEIHPLAQKAIEFANSSYDSSIRNGPRRKVLRVVIENWNNIPLGAMDYYKIYHRFGGVLRVVTFLSRQKPHAFVEFGDVISAAVAKQQMHNGFLFEDGSCRMYVDYGNRDTLEVANNNKGNHDFVLEPIPASVVDNYTIGTSLTAEEQKKGLFEPGPQDRAAIGPAGVPHLPSYSNLMDNRFNEGPPQNIPPAATSTLVNALQTLLPAMSQGPTGGNVLLQNLTKALVDNAVGNVIKGSQQQNGHNDGFVQPLFRDKNDLRNMPGVPDDPGRILLVSNLDERKLTADDLYALFGGYGILNRVTILPQKRSQAVLEFADSNGARNATRNLDGQRIYGRPMRVNEAKQAHMANVCETGGVEMDKTLSRDYSAFNAHALKTRPRAASTTVQAPSHKLCVSGFPERTPLSDIKDLFMEKDIAIEAARMIEPTAAIVECKNVDDAIYALMKLHGAGVGAASVDIRFY